MSIKLKINHFMRFFSQVIRNPDVSVIGGYHGGNLGDMALGESVKLISQGLGLRTGLQTIYNLDYLPWPKAKKATILGGGAIAYSDSLVKVRKKIKCDYSKLAFLAVDFNEKKYSKEDLEMFRKAVWISCRSTTQAENMKKLIGRKDVNFQPDLVFSYKIKECNEYRKLKKNKRLLVNVLPIYGSILEDKIIPDSSYLKERPELFNNYYTMISNYISGVKKVVKNYMDKGYIVESINFTPEDEVFARFILSDFDIHHNNYTDKIDIVLDKIGKSEIIVATRYHATIFGMKTGAKIIPIAYAKKNEELFWDFGFKNVDYISPSDLADGFSELSEPLVFDMDEVEKWEEKSLKNINLCFDKLLGVN